MLQRSLVFSLTALIGASTVQVNAQQRPTTEEVTFITDNRRLPDTEWQAELRQRNGWLQFKAQHPRWSAEFNEATGLPRRAYGTPIPMGSASEEVARQFLTTELAAYQLPIAELVTSATAPTGKLTYIHFTQEHEGLPVLGAKAMVKFDGQGRVIGFAADLIKDITVDLTPAIQASAFADLAGQGLSNIQSTEDNGLRLLAVPHGRTNDVRLVREVVVHTQRGDTPGRYRCLVDAHTGQLWYRTNEVLTCEHGDVDDAGADVTMTALAYNGSPLETPEVQNLPEIDVTVGSSLFQTDLNGFLASGIPGPASAFYQLRGRWANVSTNGVTPSFSGTVQEGANTISFNGSANIRERSAYIYVNQIHTHMKNVLPDFLGMDFPLPTRMDLTTDNCNAFYDGSSINFYAEANNCRSLATINDVVYHEYGHGINGRFYSNLSSDFTNGGMNEGYADVWALTLTQNPVLGLGINLDNDNSTVRRYDQDPKVYPIDIVGEVHSDGEIICGAWWDTYVLLGNDMDLTLELFALAFPGLQANTFNGNEGQAFRDVLLDVLQADDDDGDITNGTPNGAAIVEAFGIHGITLISDAQLIHDDLRSAAADAPISINADVVITFPSTEYLQDASLFYKVNGAADWTSIPMTSTDQSSYDASIPAQPAGTVVAYYLGLRDIFGQSSSITPVGANRLDPGLPFYMLVGYDLIATENADDLSELGPWVEGQPEDNATTGRWEFGAPLASYSDIQDIGTICQTGTQHTAGGELCWFTGNASSLSAGIGENDVDDGSTTLLGPNIDLTDYANPAMSYWRWYTNNPPSGANPNADWWQVYASSNNGNTWVRVEDTKSGERNWRRKVFRVQDVLGDVNSIRLKFIASDSTRLGQELDGGSLIEAALDDVELWDEANTSSVAEIASARLAGVWPIPANGTLNISVREGGKGTLRTEVVDLTGRVVIQTSSTSTVGISQLDVTGLAEGEYVLRLRWADGSTERRFSVIR